jgi:hypothetical protein
MPAVLYFIRYSLPGSAIGMISRFLPRALRYPRSNSAIAYTRGPAISGTRPAGRPSASSTTGRDLAGVDRLEADPGEDGNERHLGHLFAHDQERVAELGGA